MVSYPDYEEYYEYEKKTPKIEINSNVIFLIAIAIVAILVATLFYSMGFQQGSATTNTVKKIEEEQPTYIERNLNETGYNYYDYNYYSYGYSCCSSYDCSYCSKPIAKTYTIDCSIFGFLN